MEIKGKYCKDLKIFTDNIEEEALCLLYDIANHPTFVEQMKEMCVVLYAANTNIDYFPTNFVVQEDKLYYIDYECNDYMEEWNFENWGIKYWSQTKEFLEYVHMEKKQ